jgi:DNA-binding CsgD family transcriptional regulator/PAS domain-containing protein
MHNLKVFSDLVGKIYETTTNPAEWRGILEEVSRHCGAKAATMQVFAPLQSNAIRVSYEYGTNPEWSELLHGKYAALCPVGPIVAVAEVGEISSIFNYIEPAEFVETRFYKEWCLPQDYYDMAGALLVKNVQDVVALTVYGGRQRGAFKKQELELVELLAPHAKRAAMIASLLEHRTIELAALSSIIDRMATAIVVVDASGRISRHNDAAAEMMESGGVVSNRDGRLSVATQEGQRALRQALASEKSEPAIVPLGDGERGMLTAAVLPMAPRSAQFAVLLHVPPQMLPATGRILVDTFGLTRREASLVVVMLNGNTIEAAAEQLGIGLATAKTHLNRVFEKTGTNRQAELIQRVLQAMPPIRTGNQ